MNALFRPPCLFEIIECLVVCDLIVISILNFSGTASANEVVSNIFKCNELSSVCWLLRDDACSFLTCMIYFGLIFCPPINSDESNSMLRFCNSLTFLILGCYLVRAG